MRILALATALLLAGCASTAEQPPASAVPPPGPMVHRHGSLAGLTTLDLQQRFGAPRLQLRNGPGLMLQFGGGPCVLDAYLYPPASGSGAARVTHVEARRLPNGEAMREADCAALIARR